MNAKLAKHMRQHARRLMAGAPARGLIATSQGTTRTRQTGTNPDGSPRVETFSITPTLANDRKTVRGFYRDMKKGWAHKGIR